MDWGVSLAIGGIKLMVRPEDLDEARAIIGNIAGDVTPDPSPHPPPVPITCPECGSPDYERIPRLRIFGVLAAVFVGIGAAVGQMALALTGLLAIAAGVLLMPGTRCKMCRHRWNPPPAEQENAPPPDPADMIEEACPRCGSLEVYRIDDRRLKAIPLLFNPAILIAAPLWMVKPKRRCESCGLKLR
jgi:predicted RNA-binding Zn-ribbon protein involved in translation (DUF1610 family)